MTTDDDLRKELTSTVAQFANIVELESADALRLLDRIADTFVDDRARAWWWTSLSVPSVIIGYGDADGVDVLHRLLDPGTVVVLFVTDDEPSPWPAVQGPFAALSAVLGEMRQFEYFAVDPDCRWIVFDTHHNELVVAGTLRTDARMRCRLPPTQDKG